MQTLGNYHLECIWLGVVPLKSPLLVRIVELNLLYFTALVNLKPDSYINDLI